MQAWADGLLFFAEDGEDNDPNRNYVTRISSKRAPRLLTRRNAYSEMRPCGEYIVELYQRHKKRKSEPRMRLALRDHHGKVVRELAKTVREGSSIEDCDGGAVLLSYSSTDHDLTAPGARTAAADRYLFTVSL
jgi:hypothetical protein